MVFWIFFNLIELRMDNFCRYVTNAEDYLFSYIAQRNRNFVYFIKMVIIFYFGTLIPGYVFMVIEGQLEDKIKDIRYPAIRANMANSMYELGKKRLPESIHLERATYIFVEYEKKVSKLYERYPLIMLNMNKKVWTLWHSFFYAYTVYTTLGYGEFYPLTSVGRFLTMIYTLVGLPLFLIFLTDLGKVFTVAVKYLWAIVRRLYYTGSFRKKNKSTKEDPFVEPTITKSKANINIAVTRYSQEDTPTTPEISTFEIDNEFNLPISVALFILVSYIFLGAVFYSYFEHWSVFESFYYVFICLSTIGFGDFIPHDPVCEIVSLFYECFGKALMAMCFTVVQEKLSTSFQSSSKTGSDYLVEMDMDSDSIRSLDILEMEKDESVEKILKMEEEEENRLGIKRTRSVKSHFAGFIYGDINSNPIDVPIVVDGVSNI